MNSSTNNTNHHPTSFSPYLLSRFHQHLNHLNDMAFAHTKILQEMIEKRSLQSINSSPHGSISSSSPTSTSSTTIDSNQHQQQQQPPRKRSYSSHDDQHEIKNENKRPRKQSKPQQLVKITSIHHERSSTPSLPSPKSSEHGDDGDDEEEEEEEMGEINDSIEKQKSLPIPPSPMLPFPPTNLPFLNYVQDLARANHITSPLAMGRFVENLQKEYLTAAMESKHIPPSPSFSSGLFPQTVHHHHHHPYFSQILFNNSFINHFPLPSSLPRFPHSSSNDHPFHFSTPKKRRTKVTDTRLSPRITSKMTPQSNFDDLTDEEISSIDDNPTKSDQPSVEYNGFQMAMLTSLHLRKAKLMFFYTRYPNSGVLKVFFPDVRFNKVITAQLVKWFSNFREFFYQQIEKYARQCLAEGIRNPEDLIVTSNCELYRVLNLHYNRSNQINVPVSFQKATQGALREFFVAIQQQKDHESSWKKSIYKVMQQYEDQIPDLFKNDHWMHSI